MTFSTLLVKKWYLNSEWKLLTRWLKAYKAVAVSVVGLLLVLANFHISIISSLPCSNRCPLHEYTTSLHTDGDCIMLSTLLVSVINVQQASRHFFHWYTQWSFRTEDAVSTLLSGEFNVSVEENGKSLKIGTLCRASERNITLGGWWNLKSGPLL